jgi:hypothetical protein
MKKTIMVVLVLSGLLIGCSSIPKDDIEIQADRDPKANFSGYKTYGWLGSIGIVTDPEGTWEPPQFDADAEIVFLMNRELRGRGMTETDSDPDMLVAYALGVDMSALKIKQDPEHKLATLENVPQTALVVALIDTDTEFVIWASIATGEYKNLEPQVAKQRLEYAITKMFNKLPRS